MLSNEFFIIDSMGLLAYEAAIERYYSLFMGLIALVEILHLVRNLLSDIYSSYVDPRVSWQRKTDR